MTMRKFLITAAIAAATVAAASPAAAQYRGDDNRGGWNQNDRRGDRQAVNQLRRDLAQVETRIERAAQRRTISQREYQSLRRDAANIRQRLDRASRNGLNRSEVSELRQRINRLEQRVRIERRDNDGRRW
jgi:septal ring factor EnvC (AmiA/AmiB activator)